MEEKKPTGRSQKLLEVLAARKAIGVSSSTLPSGTPPSDTPGTSGSGGGEPAPTVKKVSGRGKFLIQLQERAKKLEEEKARKEQEEKERLAEERKELEEEKKSVVKKQQKPVEAKIPEIIELILRIREKLNEKVVRPKTKEEIEEVTLDISTCSLPQKFEDLCLHEEKGPVIKRGEGGEQVLLTTNYLTLKTDPGKGVYEFEVRFEPDVEFVAFRFKLINKHFRSHRGIRCYDGGSIMFLPDKITSDRLVVEANHPKDESPVQIIIIYKRQMNLEECGQLYNILFNNCAKVLHLARLGKEYFDYKIGHQIPQHKLEVWPGYVTSVKEFEGGIHLCCDIKHRVLRTESAYQVLAGIVKYDPENFQALSLKEMIGQCVLTRYNNNLYRVDDIDWTKTPTSTFKTSSGDEITFYEYYKKQYNLDIVYLKQPLLVNKTKPTKGGENRKMILLVPELCFMTGLTDKMRKDFKVMKEIATYTRVTPMQRQMSLKKFIENIKNSPKAQDMLKDWGLEIADSPVVLEGRVAPNELMYFKDKKKVMRPLNAEWSKNVRTYKVFRTLVIGYWLLIHTARDTNLAKQFSDMLVTQAVALGIEMYDPVLIPIKDDRIDSYVRASKENIQQNLQLIVYLCPTSRDDRYAAIKKVCCREIPVPSQVVNCGTISRESRMRSVVQNIALQINIKLGGASWALNIPMKNSMICGIDSYHDANRKGYSVGAFVASLDKDCTKWYSKVCIQEPGQELVDGLIHCFIRAIANYLDCNNSLPDRIIIFRDGVGDGELSTVQKYEVRQFLKACGMIIKTFQPKFAFLVVQKRINTKFYRSLGSYEEKLENPETGTILDHTITRRNYYDFFLVSQHVTCGTATPTHYIVLYDDSDLAPEHMQRLTYKFCHLYYNWPGTIKVPAPCQYAHKLAYLVGQHLRAPAHPYLDTLLYYL